MDFTRSRIAQAGLLGLVVTTLGIVVPIVWDYYKSRTALDLELLSSSTVIERDTTIKGLQVLYNNAPVNGISRLSYALANTGRTAIGQDRVVGSPWIRFPDSIRILALAVGPHTPPDLEFDAHYDSTSHRVLLRFPLLNHGDRALFSMLLSGGRPPFTAGARIAGLRQLTMSDRSEASSQANRRRPLSAGFFIVAAATFLSLVLFALSMLTIGVEIHTRDLFVAGSLAWPTRGKRTDYERFIKSVFDVKSESELAAMRKQLVSVPADDSASEALDAGLKEAATRVATTATEVMSLVIAFGVLTLAGLANLFARLL